MTTQDDTPVIDFGIHFLPSKIETHFPNTPFMGYDDPSKAYGDPLEVMKWMKAGGVDGAALSNSSYMGHDDLEETREKNDELLKIIDTHEDYWGLASVPVGAGGEAAAEEFERCLDNGFNGGGVSTTVDGKHLTDDVFTPVWEVADRVGAPVMVHPTPTHKIEPEEHVLEPVHQINHTFGREARMCGSISRVLHSTIPDEYPNLNLVYHHFGGNIAAMMGRVDLRLRRAPSEDKHTGLQGQTLPFEEFKERLERTIYVDTAGYLAYTLPLRAALEHFPPSNVLLGTDSPTEAKTPEKLNEYVSTVRQLTPQSDSAKILGGNALDLMVNV